MIIPSMLFEMESVATETARSAGFDGSVNVSFDSEYFPIRNYAGMAIPAGIYDSITVRIGSAAGRNWWCVMYPPLCLMTPDTLDAVQADPGKKASGPPITPRLLPSPADLSIVTVRDSLRLDPGALLRRATDTPRNVGLFRSVFLDWLKGFL